MPSDESVVKTVHIISPQGASFNIALYPGTEPAALTAMVAGRVGLSAGAAFYLTPALPDMKDEDDVIIPLTCALPDKMRLKLHIPEDTQPSVKKNLSTQEIFAWQPRIASGSGQEDFPRRSGRTTPHEDVQRVPRRASPQRRTEVTFSSPNSSVLSFSAQPQRGRTSSRLLDELPARDTLQSPLLKSPSPNPPARVVAEPVRTRSESPARDNSSPWNLMTKVFSSAGGKRRFNLRRSWSAGPSRWDEDMQPGLERRASTEMEVVTAVERFSRLSTELANERTLLAWVRTCLAAVRTALSYIGFAAAQSEWWITLMLAQWGMFALIVLAALAGASRYYRLKAVLEYKVPPRKFGRISLTPLNVLVVVAAVATAAGLAAKSWSKH